MAWYQKAMDTCVLSENNPPKKLVLAFENAPPPANPTHRPTHPPRAGYGGKKDWLCSIPILVCKGYASHVCISVLNCTIAELDIKLLRKDERKKCECFTE